MREIPVNVKKDGSIELYTNILGDLYVKHEYSYPAARDFFETVFEEWLPQLKEIVKDHRGKQKEQTKLLIEAVELFLQKLQ